jgi:hypothetical protein
VRKFQNLAASAAFSTLTVFARLATNSSGGSSDMTGPLSGHCAIHSHLRRGLQGSAIMSGVENSRFADNPVAHSGKHDAVAVSKFSMRPASSTGWNVTRPHAAPLKRAARQFRVKTVTGAEGLAFEVCRRLAGVRANPDRAESAHCGFNESNRK